MAVKLLESFDLGTFEEECKAMSDDYELKKDLRKNYEGRNIGFQTVSCYNKNIYQLNVFEML